MKETKSAIFKVAYKFLGPEELEAFAAEDDPTKSWIHFIFTDDMPNANKKRVPVEEFDNIIRSGKHMPIKKRIGETSPDHEGVVPMGTIASMKRELGEKKNIIEGLGILWKKEFPEDVASLKEASKKGEPIDFSWEILYSEDVAEEDDVSALKGCITRAITIVDLPAYEGRTRALAMATKESFEERQEKIRSALDKFKLNRDGYDSYRYYLVETFYDSAVIKDREDGNFYEVSYSIKEDGVEFDFGNQKKVEREYVVVSGEITLEEKLITGIASKAALAATGKKEKEAQRKRAAKYGIQVRPDGNVTKPKEYAHLNDSQFADPVNYAYPIDKEHILAALRYWGKPKNKAKYNAKSRAIITRRMTAAARRFKVKSVVQREATMFDKLNKMLEGLEPEDAVAAVSEELKEVFEELEELRGHKDELAELREFKTEREEEEAKATLLKSRLEKMKEAGLEVSEEDVEKKAKTWLSMDDEAFEFYVNELVAFATAVKEGKASLVPNLRGDEEEESDLDIVKEGFEAIFKESKSEEDKEE